MTPIERAAFNAGVKAALNAAQITASVAADPSEDLSKPFVPSKHCDEWLSESVDLVQM